MHETTWMDLKNIMLSEEALHKSVYSVLRLYDSLNRQNYGGKNQNSGCLCTVGEDMEWERPEGTFWE